VKSTKSSVNGLCDMLVGEEKLLLDCKMGWRVRRDMSGGKEGRHTQFSNSSNTSFFRSLMDTRDSRLLIVNTVAVSRPRPSGKK
jgi:hypothetical protein